MNTPSPDLLSESTATGEIHGRIELVDDLDMLG